MNETGFLSKLNRSRVTAALLCLAVFLVLCEVAPDFVDSLLYTQEELKIINY